MRAVSYTHLDVYKRQSVDRMANRLASESSPYLLQHAENPVDWYPWGDAAFERARTEDRLSLIHI